MLINKKVKYYSMSISTILIYFQIAIIFVELGGGVGDVLVWCREGAYVEFGFR